MRDDHTKVFEVIKLEPVLDPVTLEPTGETEEVAYQIIWKGDNLHYKGGSEDDPVWLDPDPLFYRSGSGRWESLKGRHQVSLPGVLSQSSEIIFRIGDNDFKSVPVKVMYVEEDSGKTHDLGWLKSPQAVVEGNKVTYPDAFTGLSVDLRYTNTPAYLKQDFIIKSQPPDPAEFGLNPLRTSLVVLTELINLRDYVGSAIQICGDGCPLDLARLGDHGLGISSLSFLQQGTEKKYLHAFTPGIAFEGGTLGERRHYRHVSVRKKLWLDGWKSYLWEEVPCAFLKKAHYPLTVDYSNRSGIISSSEIWPAGPTYYVGGTVTLGDGVTLRLDPGAIVKFANDTYGESGIKVSGSGSKLVAEGLSNSPIILSSKNDNSTGETISGSTGSPAGGDYANAISLGWNSSTGSKVSYCRIGFADTGIEIGNTLDSPIRNNVISEIETAGIGSWTAQTISFKLLNNLIREVEGDGIHVDTDQSSVEIQNSTLDHCDCSGIALEGLSAEIEVKNNLFTWCGTAFSAETLPPGNNDYNGYFSNGTDLYGPASESHGVSLSTSPFAGSEEEPYYLDQGCDLIDAGSWSSASAGLSVFFTTKYSYPRTADANTVDIGYHYPTFDADNDGMPDTWEYLYGLDLYSNDASSDPDNDGYTNITEYRGGSHPKKASSVPLKYVLRGGDFNGDGLIDVCVFRSYYGNWYIRGISNVHYGQNNDVPVPGDYDGNGTADIAVWRPVTGIWYVLNQTSLQYGADGDIPVQGDWQGNGTADKAVFRPSTAYWYVWNFTRFSYGISSDIPVPGDYSGDGTRRAAVFRSSNATWYIRNFTSMIWGASGDFPVPRDYDGDGTCDLALFSPQACSPNPALWKIRYLSGGYENQSFGWYGDIPSPEDYNGDGTTELATFRPYYSINNWNIQGLTVVSYGLTGDTPLPGFWLGSDSDNDRLPDDWEEFYFGNLLQRPQSDHPDYDQLINFDEYQYGTSPLISDTDADGLTDSQEVKTYHTNPLDPDSDDDGLSDFQEVEIYETDPNDPDSDDDGFSDGWEVGYNTNPNAADTDNDGSNDWDEYYYWIDHGWSPQSDFDHDFYVNIRDWDTDGDGMADGWEFYYWCVDAAAFDAYTDPDQDGFLNLAEYQAKTDPCDPSSKPPGAPPSSYPSGCVVINEVVTDPQADWNDSSPPPEGRIRFNAVPGTGGVNNDDQWIELFNTQTDSPPVDLTGWALYMKDISYCRYGLGDDVSTVTLRFNDSSSLTAFQNGGYLVIGNPPGALANTTFLELRDGAGTLIDTVELGDDPENDGLGDGAPDGSSLGGSSGSLSTEAVARAPNGWDSDPDEDGEPSQADVDDFIRQASTIGQANSSPQGYSPGTVVINEVVIDPRSDWNDSAGGNGIAFDEFPGEGSITVSDQWVELFNTHTDSINLSGWTLEIVSGDPSETVIQPLGSGTAVFRFSAAGDFNDFQPGEFLTLGNPRGFLREDCLLRLKDAAGTVIDQVEIGDDPEQDGDGDGAPDGTARGGRSTGPSDEAIFRFPDGWDTDNDVADFYRGPASIVGANYSPQTTSSGAVVINEVVTDPKQDWNDSTGGDGIPFNPQPGNGTVDSHDQWIELYNVSASSLDLTGWSLLMIDAESYYYWTEEMFGESAATLRFGDFSTLTDFQPGDFLVVGDPMGSLNDRVLIELFDREGTLIDQVELGDDPRDDGRGNGAPDGGSFGGYAAAPSVEAVARRPVAIDTASDPADFVKQSATIGAANQPPYSASPGAVVINEIVTSPKRDWSDSTGGNGIVFDAVPGTAQPGTDDEWIELYNRSGGEIDLSGWYLRIWTSETSVETETLGGSPAALVFSQGSSLNSFQPGDYLVIGDLLTALSDRAYFELFDPAGNLIDDVELGDDPESDGEGDGAPGGSSAGGFSRGIPDESVARCPNAWDEDTDAADFVRREATIGTANPSALPDPVITGISPAQGYYSGGTPVVIEGFHFGTDSETAAWVGETSLFDQEVVSPYEIWGNTGWSSVTGPVDVTVEVSGRQGVLNDAFIYLGLPSPEILTSDSDGDGLSLAEETALGTNPDQEDSDGDGLKDGAERDYWLNRGLDPLGDCDQDSIVNILDSDSDNDGISDGTEIAQKTDPCNDDTSAPSIQITDPQNSQTFY